VLDRLAHRFYRVAGFGQRQFVCDVMFEVSLV
jgi:hypothetical protein